LALKHTIVFSVLLALCLRLPMLAADEAAVEFLLSADVQTVSEGGNIQFSVFINEDVTIDEGLIKLVVPEDIFIEPITEKAIEPGSDEAHDSQLPVAVFNFTLSDSILGQEEQKEFEVFIHADTYIQIDGVDYFAPDDIYETFTVIPATINGEIITYCNLSNSDNISAALKGGQNEFNMSVELSENGKLIFSGRKPLIEPDLDYKIIITGAGFTSAQTEFDETAQMKVNGFYPGDVNDDGKIDIFDFNLLCSYISYNQYDAVADFNRDNKVDGKDIECFIAGYNAKKASN